MAPLACGDNLSSGRDGGGGGGGGDDGGAQADAALADADPADLVPTDGDLCASADDCAEGSSCTPDQSETSGTCATTPCTPGDDDTCAPEGDGTCVDFDDEDAGEDPLCLDPCEEDGDCDEGQRCAETGDADVDGTFCRHAEIGEACEGAGSCGGEPWMCQEGGDYPGGHCTIPCDGASCPDGYVCRSKELEAGTDPYCVVACENLVDTCPRASEGYVCLDVGAAGGNQVGCSADLDL